MNRPTLRPIRGAALLAASIATVLLGACAAAPQRPAGAADVHAKLIALQSDPSLANLAPAAMADAQAAVLTAERPEPDRALADYRVYVADRKVDTAKALAETRFAENQRAQITAQRTAARLESRTREADAANAEAHAANADAATARADARTQAEDASATADEMQQQIDALKAKATDRGLVLTLGDVLFTTGHATLKSGATGHLDQLVAFLNRYPDRTAVIEGYTDNVGSEDYNQGLSERRAEAVRNYLTDQGIAAGRLRATGKGEASPVAGNDTAAGRQRNRRVEVVINTAPTASSTAPGR